MAGVHLYCRRTQSRRLLEERKIFVPLRIGNFVQFYQNNKLFLQPSAGAPYLCSNFNADLLAVGWQTCIWAGGCMLLVGRSNLTVRPPEQEKEGLVR